MRLVFAINSKSQFCIREAWGRTGGTGAGREGVGRKPTWVPGRPGAAGSQEELTTGRHVNNLCSDLLISWVLCLSKPWLYSPVSYSGAQK